MDHKGLVSTGTRLIYSDPIEELDPITGYVLLIKSRNRTSCLT